MRKVNTFSFSYPPPPFLSQAVQFVCPSLNVVSLQRNELCVAVQRCTDLQSSSSSPPSPYVVYKFYEFLDHPTATAPPCWSPRLEDRRLFPVLMDAELHRYLQSKELLLYVFDYNEQRMDTYLGKTRVPLLPLSRDQGVSGQNSLSALS